MRRLLALTMLILTTTSSLEAVLGVVRDGEVHHEDAAAAAAHTQHFDGDHGHEDAVPAGDNRQAGDHEHGTASDHCTHVHAMALLPSFAFVILIAEASTQYSEKSLPHSLLSETFSRPPRA